MTNNQKSLKQIADEVVKVKGNVKGEVFHTHERYIRYRKGEEGIRAVEQKLEELGYPLKFKEIKPLKWYRDAYSILVIITAYKIFNWTESDIFDMGQSAPAYSLIVKLLTKYFISPRIGYEAAPKYWKKHFDFGKMETPEFNDKEKYCVVRLKEYKFHPIICVFLSGYFVTFGRMVLQGKNVTIEEPKCMHRGDSYHEWVVRWE